MIKNKILKIKRELVKRKEFTKFEIKHIILKSVYQNRSVQPLIRIKAMRKNCKRSYFSYISKQKNNICIKTGRIKGVYNSFTLSRHYMKYLANHGNLQNIKIASW